MDSSSRTASPGSLPPGNQLARGAIGLREVLLIVYLIYLSASAPQRLRDTAKVFIEEEVAEVSAPV